MASWSCSGPTRPSRGRAGHPRKGGPGITRSDLLVINKTDLAPHVGVLTEGLARDAAAQRGARPFVLASLRHGVGAEEIAAFLLRHGGLATGLATAGGEAEGGS